MIIITGFGRTGTSFLAMWLKELGFITYEHGYTETVNAGIEPLDITRINNALLENPTVTPEIVNAISCFSYPVVKDPRFMYGNILKIWTDIRKDLKILVLHRMPKDIYSSRSSFCAKIPCSASFLLDPSELNRKFGEFMTTCISRNIQVEFLFFPDFIDTYKCVWDKLTKLGLTIDYMKGEEVWNKLVDKTKIHHGFK